MDSITEDSDPKRDIWELRLYVAGQTAKSVAAFKNLQQICDEHLPGKCRIEVVDLLISPRMGCEDQIVALPTLVRKAPSPTLKIVGDLSNREQVLVRLQLRPTSQSTQGKLDVPRE